MAKITRKDAKIFGSTALVNEIGQFGSFAAGSPAYSTDPDTIQSLSEWVSGWFAATIGSNSPAIEDMNAFCYVMAYQIAYGFQAGVAEWSAGTTYYIGSCANDGTGKIYASLQDDNTNHALTDGSWWVAITGPDFLTATVKGANIVAGQGDGTGTTTLGTFRGPARTGSNAAGVNTNFDAANGTGTGGSGSLIFRTAPIAGSSSTANTFANRMIIDNTGLITILNNILIGSTGVSTGLSSSSTKNIGNKSASILFSDVTSNGELDLMGNIYYDGSFRYTTANSTGGIYTIINQAALTGAVHSWSCGSSVASAAGSVVSLTNVGSITGNGLWTFGASGGTQRHVFNGTLNITHGQTGVAAQVLTNTGTSQVYSSYFSNGSNVWDTGVDNTTGSTTGTASAFYWFGSALRMVLTRDGIIDFRSAAGTTASGSLYITGSGNADPNIITYRTGSTVRWIVGADSITPTYIRSLCYFWYNGADIVAHLMAVPTSGGANSANTILNIRQATSTSRSINAAGTLNASGADYAEYMIKSSPESEIEPGEICGIDQYGSLTKKYSKSHSFMVKSTSPSFVGGDNWFNHEREEYETDEDFENAMEEARIAVDRIAFCGQVPCLISGPFEAGDWILPQEGPNDSIIGVAINQYDLTFDHFKNAIGKVWKILEPGKAIVAVGVK